MKVQFSQKIAAVVFVGTIAVFIGACKASDKKIGSEDRVAVLLDATPDVVVIRNSQTLEAKAGLVLRRDDRIESKSGSADIQTVRGDIIRVGQYSKVTMSQYTFGTQEKGTEMELNAGSLIAEVNKNESREGFRIRTPTAIASVRGTSFLVELQDEKIPRIKVFDGAVALAPSVAVLDEFTEEEVQQNESLKKLTEVLASHEIVIEEATEAQFKPEAAEIVFMINTRFKKSDFLARSKGDKTVDSETLIKQELENLKAVEMSVSRPSPVSPREKADLKTMVGVDYALVVEAVETDIEFQKGESSSEQADPGDISRKIATAQEENLNSALVEVTREAESENLKTEEEIQKFYNILEVLVKKDGTKLSGAVVTQAKDALIMHTTDGVKRVDRNEVDYIDFYDYEIKLQEKKKQ